MPSPSHNMAADGGPSSWTEEQKKENAMLRKQYDLEGHKVDDFLGHDSFNSPSRKTIKKKWNNKPTDECAMRCGDWLSPPSDDLALASPDAKKKCSYRIIREIPQSEVERW